MVFNCDCIGFVKTLQKPWGRVGIFHLLLQSRPPQKKIGGALPFTIIDVTLYIIHPISCVVSVLIQSFPGIRELPGGN